MAKKVNYVALFEELANPDKDGVSRWVQTSEFVNRYSALALGNGGSWCRKDGAFGKKYNVKFEYGPSAKGARCITAIRTLGFNQQDFFEESIRGDIRRALKDKNCVMLGVRGNGNLQIEIDHKDGRKKDMRVSNKETQRVEDFQPLTKVANDLKRNICQKCAATNERWDATQIEGNIYPFYAGDKTYTPELGCVGCYMYDPVAYRKESFKRYFEEALSSADAEHITYSKATFNQIYNNVTSEVLKKLLDTMYGEKD